MPSLAKDMTHRPVAVGNEIYVWTNNSGTGTATAVDLLISCHGGYIPRAKSTEWREGKDGWLKVPQGTTLVFYTLHGNVLDNPGILKILQGTQFPVDAAKPGDSVRNYRLTKFQTRDTGETYDTIVAGVQYSHANRPNRYPFDFLTIRNRWWNRVGGTTLRNVLQRLSKNGFTYERIHCSFCRSSVFG